VNVNDVVVVPEPGDATPSLSVVIGGVPSQAPARTAPGPVPTWDRPTTIPSANIVARRVRGEGCLFMAA
jgi:hypothetical protein